MYITIPLILIGVSVLALAIMVMRKWPYLKKLEPDAHQVGDSFVHDLAPEAVEKAKSVDWRGMWHQGMNGVEEFLKIIRSGFTAIGHASEKLRSSVQSVKEKVAEPTPQPEPVEAQPAPQVAVPSRDDEAEQRRLLKEEEQRLILDIAQDPKNVNLYTALGKVYTKLDNAEDALESYKTAAKIDPDDMQIKEKIDRLQAKLEREEGQKRKEEELAQQEQADNEKTE